MDTNVRQFFRRCERLFGQALDGTATMEEVATLYAPEFIAASPAGVSAGKNDGQLRQRMAEGYAHYRAIGTKGMHIRVIRLSPMDEHHCVAHVGWTAFHARKGQPDVSIDFEVHYLVQMRDGEAKLFGWIAGDEKRTRC